MRASFFNFFCISFTICFLSLSMILKVKAAVCSYTQLGQIHLDNVDGFLVGGVILNGQLFNMVIDTGSEGSLISPKWAEFLNLPIDHHRKTVLTGSRGGQNLVHNVVLNQINLGKLSIGPYTIPLGYLPGYPGINPPVVGLIGGDILSHFDLEFDLVDQKLSFWEIKTGSVLCRPLPFWNKFSQIDLIRKSHRLFVNVFVNNTPISALIDSGARSRIIALDKVIHMGISLKTLMLDPGGFASGIDMKETRYYWHRFKKFQIGDNVEYNPILTVSKLNDDSEMLLGSDWFENKKIWISYYRSKLYLLSDGNTHKKN
ncbi:hypothetical protein COMNV_00699 [Commensalibacter sp. Nvir]|uniref:retropepsin-like aspartic protease n=1 Tax=Commensalibacter sp. Nvir TaxID=3069817 RepID=UPI002D6FB97F|nr:hypothetical protein COMNV_00699 [Commensalibacter sp. Nvir]